MWGSYVSTSCSRLASRVPLLQVLSRYSTRHLTLRHAPVHGNHRTRTGGKLQGHYRVTSRSCSGLCGTAQSPPSSDKAYSSVCCGCGASLQSENPASPGFVPPQKCSAVPSGDGDESVSEKWLVCQRCFSLKHYNTAINIALKKDDYVRHLQHIKGRRVLVLLMVDVIDFPGSLFPELNTFITPPAQVMVVANKIDLLPSSVKPDFFNKLSSYIAQECSRASLAGCNIVGVHFVSAKTGEGVSKLTDAVHTQWGNRGDVYLVGCTNVGKSSLFNLLLATLCGAKPGELHTTSHVSAPMATVSNWPGTTLGLLKFPLLSVGKRKRLVARSKEKEGVEFPLDVRPEDEDEDEDISGITGKLLTRKEARILATKSCTAEAEDALAEVGLHMRRHHESVPGELEPKNRFWLYDTPGAINDAQLINLLTTEELRLGLPKKPLKPRTFIMKPGQTLFLAGLGRVDYAQGCVSIYATVFAPVYLPVHVTRTDKADSLYAKNLGGSLLKVPCGDTQRLQAFPQLQPQEVKVTGINWKHSAVDIILSSAGWVAITIGAGQTGVFVAYTPLAKGIFVRSPPLFPLAINSRGKRVDKGNRSTFRGK